MSNKELLSIVHKYLYGQLRRKVQGNIITKEKINSIVRTHCHFPKQIQYEIIQEMIDLGLLHKISLAEFEIITKMSILKNKPLYDSLGNPLW